MAENTLSQALRLVTANLRDSERDLRYALQSGAVKSALERIPPYQDLIADPGPVRYTRTLKGGGKGLRWKSDKQRKAFFASNGFGRGIPTRRTGKIREAWVIGFYPSRRIIGQIVVSNDHPAVNFVQGQWQQPFHQDTGWVKDSSVAPNILNFAEGIVIDTFIVACDPLRGL